MKETRLFLVFICLLFTYSSNAQNGTISGVVSDEFGELPGAKVELIGTGKSGYCDINGQFKFEVEPGQYTLKVSYLMYQSKEQHVKVDFQTLNPDLKIVLIPGSSADETVGLGSRFEPKSLLESPVALDIITNEDIVNSERLNLNEVLMYLIPSFNSKMVQ